MTPYEEARAIYTKEPCKRTFGEDLVAYFLHGYVISTPDFFVMARPVNGAAMPSMIVDSRVQFPRDTWNCWHVHLMAGNMAKAWAALPFDLPLFTFERQNVLRMHRTNRIRALCNVKA